MDATTLASLVSAVVVLIGALTAYLKSRTTQNKLDNIHILVNSRLSGALDDINTLKGYIAETAKPGDPPVPPLTQVPPPETPAA